MVGLMVLALCGGARADDVNKAREAFKRGSRLYDLQRYQEAAAAYEEAYQAKDDPALLFNIGQAYRGAKEYEKAIGAYKAYLRNLPGAPNRALVEQRIEELRRLAEEDRKSQDRPPAGTLPPSTPEPPPGQVTQPVVPPPASAPPRGRHNHEITGWALLGAGAAIAVVGAALVGVAYGDAGALNNPSGGTTYSADGEDRIKAMEISGGVLLGVGVAAAASGVVTALIARRSSRVQAGAAVGPGRGFVQMTVSF
jgi:tetratricopeptide (TPR) repeat protein